MIYKQKKLKNNIFIRTFDENVSKDDLVWHYDLNNRNITVIESNNWMFQFDDELPFFLKEKKKINIPKNVYHRIIKGNGKLVLKIEEY